MRQCLTAITLVTSLFAVLPVARGEVRSDEEKRVARPDWSNPAEIDDIFFADAFNQALVGERPPHLLPKAETTGPDATRSSGPADNRTSAAAGWSRFASAETLGNEVKTIGNRLAKLTANKRRFLENKGDVEIDLGILAIVCAILDDYDQDIRWKSRLTEVRSQIETAQATHQDNTRYFDSAKLVSSLLSDLVRGSLPRSEAAHETNWPGIVDRAIVMARLETAIDERIAKALPNATRNNKDAARLLHEAQIIAVLGQVLIQNGVSDADDEAYVEHCRQLTGSAVAFTQQLTAGESGQLTMGVQRLEQRCTDCHDEYR